MIFGFIFFIVVKKDPGYQEYSRENPWTPKIIAILGTIFSFKLYKLFYSKFFGATRFYIPFEYPSRIHTIFNIMTVINIIMVLLPIIGVDLYGLIKYNWGG